MLKFLFTHPENENCESDQCIPVNLVASVFNLYKYSRMHQRPKICEMSMSSLEPDIWVIA